MRVNEIKKRKTNGRRVFKKTDYCMRASKHSSGKGGKQKRIWEEIQSC